MKGDGSPAAVDPLTEASYTAFMTWEKTLVLIKPDGVKRGLMGAVLKRYEQAGLVITAMNFVSADRERAEEHYGEHRGKSFFPPLVDLLLSGPTLALCVEGSLAIEVVRKLNGDTEPRTAAPGTIRGDYCHMGYGRSPELNGVINNVVHASDSTESAERELAIWFDKENYVQPYDTVLKGFI
ncbi:MAG: nucleoside-diphosphate kinase [Spirochaetales bacterium]|nr:nucleoside-diphosphate kinase [Spirochaetales bacterium]